jgi:hypothetical protein
MDIELIGLDGLAATRQITAADTWRADHRRHHVDVSGVHRSRETGGRILGVVNDVPPGSGRRGETVV